MERAVAAELDNTATIITKTGIFDTVDRLYKTVTGGTASAGGAAAPPAGGEGGAPPPPPAGGEEGGAPPIPESIRKDKNKLILESEIDDFDEDEFLDFQKVNNTLGEVTDELSKLLGD
jgi:hypothetical protein